MTPMVKNRGFTLVEVIVAVGISMILLLIIGSVITMINRQFVQTRERLVAEESAARAEYLLKAYLSQAINVRASVDATWNLGTRGQIIDNFTYDQMADTPSDWTILAAFPREISHGMGAGMQLSQLVNTVIWYRKPDATTSPPTSGMIFLSSSVGGAALAPNYGHEFIDRISFLSFKKNVHTPSDQVASVDVTVRIRFHTSPSGPRNWCPRADIGVVAACDPNAPWLDIERSFNVLLRNNRIKAAGAIGGSTVASEERVLGNLYFFQPFLPLR